MPPRDVLKFPRRHALSMKLAVEGMPEVMAMLRRQLAGILRDQAAIEEPAVGARLRAIADAFEGEEDGAGQ